MSQDVTAAPETRAWAHASEANRRATSRVRLCRHGEGHQPPSSVNETVSDSSSVNAMGRPAKGAGGTVTVGTRVPADTLAAIDAARGGRSRSVWLDGLIAAALAGEPAAAMPASRAEPATVKHVEPVKPAAEAAPAAALARPSLSRFGADRHPFKPGLSPLRCEVCGVPLRGH
jgi:hypothetical protein